MPDKYSSMFIENGLIILLLENLFKYSRPNIICNLLKVLRHLATNDDVKAYILKYNGLEKAMIFQGNSDGSVKLEALRLIANLA